MKLYMYLPFVENKRNTDNLGKLKPWKKNQNHEEKRFSESRTLTFRNLLVHLHTRDVTRNTATTRHLLDRIYCKLLPVLQSQGSLNQLYTAFHEASCDIAMHKITISPILKKIY